MPYPTSTELIFSEQANHNFSKTLGELKRSTLSIGNRLQSIVSDARFAESVADAYGRPLIANERCGSWYIPPHRKGGSAYFKSTDGHTGVWKFSSRRLNVHLLEIIGKNDGCIIVDSTRRGKSMPDALSKTIPIWCSVFNRVLFPDDQEAHCLYTPPQVVSQSENAQITALLPTFCKSLLDLDLPLDALRSQITKPLRPFWTTPVSQVFSMDIIFDDFHPVVCCTVSRRVHGTESSEGGYIQGAGDDTENWALGLTASVFWANQPTLTCTQESELPELIENLSSAAKNVGIKEIGLRCASPTSSLFIVPLLAAPARNADPETYFISLLPTITREEDWKKSASSFEVGLGSQKLGSRNLRAALPAIADFADKLTMRESGISSECSSKRIIVACESGTDLSIGAALALLCLFYDEDGKLLRSGRNTKINKDFIRKRLSWISMSFPDANPSRATLQSVNSFLMPR